MEAVLIGAGIVLALWGLWAARKGDGTRRPRRRRGRPEGSPAGADAAGLDPAADPREQAMAVLRQPLSFEPEGWSGLAGASPLRQFRLGALFGLGTGLALAGAAMAFYVYMGGPGDGAVAADPGAGQTAAVPRQTDAGGGGLGGLDVEGPAPDDPGAGSGAGGGPADPAAGSGGTGPDGAGSGGAPADPGSTGPTGGSTGPEGSGGGASAPPAPLQVTFIIKAGESPYRVAANLKQAGLIPDEQAFISRLVERRLDTRLQAGRFRLNTGMTLDQVISELTGA